MGKKMFTTIHSKNVFAAAVWAGFIVFLHVEGVYSSDHAVFWGHLWYRLKI